MKSFFKAMARFTTITEHVNKYPLFQPGSIKFIRAKRRQEEKENIVDDFEAFQGKGQSLRQAKKK